MVGEQKNKKMASVVFHVFSCLLGFIMIYPLLWLVASSFKSNNTMFKNTYSLLPESWGIIKNYTSGFASTAGYSFGHFFMNSPSLRSSALSARFSPPCWRPMRYSASSSSVPISGLAASP